MRVFCESLCKKSESVRGSILEKPKRNFLWPKDQHHHFIFCRFLCHTCTVCMQNTKTQHSSKSFPSCGLWYSIIRTQWKYNSSSTSRNVRIFFFFVCCCPKARKVDARNDCCVWKISGFSWISSTYKRPPRWRKKKHLQKTCSLLLNFLSDMTSVYCTFFTWDSKSPCGFGLSRHVWNGTLRQEIITEQSLSLFRCILLSDCLCSSFIALMVDFSHLLTPPSLNVFFFCDPILGIKYFQSVRNLFDVVNFKQCQRRWIKINSAPNTSQLPGVRLHTSSWKSQSSHDIFRHGTSWQFRFFVSYQHRSKIHTERDNEEKLQNVVSVFPISQHLSEARELCKQSEHKDATTAPTYRNWTRKKNKYA